MQCIAPWFSLLRVLRVSVVNLPYPFNPTNPIASGFTSDDTSL